ncbi:glycosyltransferase [Marinobacterium mangrovicola]|uniref:Glycosyl transferase family 2 n=1 Tax=Marinobacterium mangrovicola TaxID=1476959 RepID=A0A4R1GBL6_9GAMM|nr:glycosyltransferase [Marinobacterium mangrovicola]TCK03059.1 glycosyl transferase family 2 [Marinobacterium mangrovicola]
MATNTPPMSHLCICVCTRERPTMLGRFIDSYLQLNLPEGLSISLEVVENNTHREMEALVTNAGTESRPVHYHHQAKLGIPCARNTSIQAAIDRNASHIAFVDDDERFAPDWLVNIWHYLNSQADETVVHGAVYSVLPQSAPQYYLDFFQRQIEATGSELDFCRTNNVILPLSILTRNKLWFDESQPLAGGTDSKLFRAVHALGISIKSCAEAVVYEDVPDERVTLRWLSHRNFRIGMTMGEQAAQVSNRYTHFLRQSGKSLVYLLKYLIRTLLMQRREKRIRYWFKACKSAGSGLGSLGCRVDAYKKIQGH